MSADRLSTRRAGVLARLGALVIAIAAALLVVLLAACGRAPDGRSIRVRGPATLLGRGEPLVVLDGQPLARGVRALLLINPADVARVEVLKDGGSTALHGVRGSNGVPLVTARRPVR